MRRALSLGTFATEGLAIGFTVLLLVGSARAQDVEPSETVESDTEEGRAFGVGAALGAGRMGVSGSSSSTFVAGFSARLGLDSRNRYQLIGELQPMKVESPIIDESFTSANVLLGYRIGQRFRIRPAAGVQFRWWSGAQRVTASDWGLLLGLDVGRDLRLSDTVSLSPELVLRWSLIEPEGDVSSSFVGGQCVVSWRRGR